MKEQNYLYINELKEDILYMFPFVHPDVAVFIACQSACETAYGRSTIYLENNNLFGMKRARMRLQSAIGLHRDHCVYFDRCQSINDYFLWLAFHAFVQSDFRSLDSFVSRFPWSVYCPENDGYLASIQSIYKSFKNYSK